MDEEEQAQHSLLRRQVRRFFGSPDDVPPAAVEFVAAIDEAYRQFDADRLMLERTLELSSDELLQANADLRAVLEGLVDWFLRIDRDGLILDYRRGKGTALELSEPLVGRLHEIPELAASGLSVGIEKALATRRQCLVEFDLDLGQDRRHVHATFLPVHNEQLNVVIQDRSVQKSAVTREKALSARLARSERLESLGILAGGVAHDLNNILGPLVGYPDLMLDDVPEGSRVYNDLLTIRNSGLRAAAVIRDLLTLARRGTHQTELVDLNEIARDFLASPVWRELESSRPELRVEVRLQEDLPPVMASPHHMGQTFMNLALNACEAIDGAGTVRIQTEVRYLDQPVSGYDTVADGEYAVLHVGDSGRGIEKEDLEHIFEPFYTNKKMGRSGTGLGLSVVYASVKDAEGYVDVRTEPGEGSDFVLYLPARPRALTSVLGEASVIGGGESILVVDDVPEQREVAVRLLTRLGYVVTTAENGRSALDLVEDRPFHLIILDMIMEDDFDGLDTYRAIRSRRPDQRCVIASGFAENAKVREAQALGAGAYIQKPYTVDKLGRAVRTELQRADRDDLSEDLAPSAV